MAQLDHRYWSEWQGAEAGLYEAIVTQPPVDTVSDWQGAEEFCYLNAGTCPDCGGAMIRMGGCFSCPGCGYQSCGM